MISSAPLRHLTARLERIRPRPRTEPARPAANRGRFAEHFRACYLRSLEDYKFFYDDIEEIGREADARHVFYFVPGVSGTPGQMRFLLPSLTRVFGPRVFLKALHVPEFSARAPIWTKYTTANVDRKLARLRGDLEHLLQRHDRIGVLCSSNGFYDFAAALSGLPRSLVAGRIELAWGACAPDHFEPTPWESVFYPVNGFVHEGHRWFAYPNHNAFTVFNPETSVSFDWRDGHQRRQFAKIDLESRFHCCGLQWDYVSPSQLGAAVAHVVRQIDRAWEFESEALIASNDGYWQGKPRSEIEQTIRRYLPHARLVFSPMSHLWVVHPTNLTQLFERMKPRLPPLRA